MFFFRLLSRLPFPVLYAVSDALFGLFYHVIKYRKSVVLSNLMRAFPEKSQHEIAQIARHFYRNLTDVVVETVKALTISEVEMQRRVTIQNPDFFRAYAERNQPVMVLASHQANWEWLLLANALNITCRLDAVYKPLSNAFFDRLMCTIRSRFGSQPVSVQKLPRAIFGSPAQARVMAMVADQTPLPEHAYWTTFLHQDTPFFAGAAKIARRLNCPVFYADMQRVRRGYYQIIITLLAESPGQLSSETDVIDAYVNQVEASIRRTPAEWLWSHKRWKHVRRLQADKH